jgi:hypothetical protein
MRAAACARVERNVDVSLISEYAVIIISLIKLNLTSSRIPRTIFAKYSCQKTCAYNC